MEDIHLHSGVQLTLGLCCVGGILFFSVRGGRAKMMIKKKKEKKKLGLGYPPVGG